MKARSERTIPPVADAGATTLESFVAQLHRDGVASGQQEAERLVRAAEEEAAEILRRAHAEADAMLAEEREQVARLVERGRGELELAARDTLLRLQNAVEEVLGALLQAETREVLRDREFLRQLVSGVVGAYAAADAAGRPAALRLPESEAGRLQDWAAGLVSAGLQGDGAVSATLRDAGFEYRLGGGGVVEVSTAALVEQLLELVRPGLRELLREAAAPAAEPGPAGDAVRRRSRAH